jgi:hypothetical protein
MNQRRYTIWDDKFDKIEYEVGDGSKGVPADKAKLQELLAMLALYIEAEPDIDTTLKPAASKPTRKLTPRVVVDVSEKEVLRVYERDEEANTCNLSISQIADLTLRILIANSIAPDPDFIQVESEPVQAQPEPRRDTLKQVTPQQQTTKKPLNWKLIIGLGTLVISNCCCCLLIVIAYIGVNTFFAIIEAITHPGR